jgi:integrase
VIALDRSTIAALREHRVRQRAERAAAGSRWRETGYVFTTGAGKPVGPDRMTRLFRRLVTESGLPPVTLHGLRHGAATLAQGRGVASDASFPGLCEEGAVRAAAYCLCA